ncbi:gag-pol polyprotein [Tanacetum coccineum]|uniref:Gag-pol polyprotein n=1 Tax=Tanacetum coccineum TaxID=301880 RepID=A0ABQ5E5I4_9ASTR
MLNSTSCESSLKVNDSYESASCKENGIRRESSPSEFKVGWFILNELGPPVSDVGKSLSLTQSVGPHGYQCVNENELDASLLIPFETTFCSNATQENASVRTSKKFIAFVILCATRKDFRDVQMSSIGWMWRFQLSFKQVSGVFMALDCLIFLKIPSDGVTMKSRVPGIILVRGTILEIGRGNLHTIEEDYADFFACTPERIFTKHPNDKEAVVVGVFMALDCLIFLKTPSDGVTMKSRVPGIILVRGTVLEIGRGLQANGVHEFCSGADYSFISTNFLPLINMKPSVISPGYEIEIANGLKVVTNMIVQGCRLELEGNTFIIDLIPFGHGSFDVIVGIDWLSKRRAKIVCFVKIVQIPLSNGEILEVQGERLEGNLKQLKTIKVNEPKLEDILVVREFLGVFPKDLSGLPPSCEVEFRIDLIPGAMPVAKSPYRLEPMEMQELSNQLKELQDKAEVTDDSKWDEMDGNAIANLHLALADGVLSSIEEKKSAKEIWDHLARLYEARSLHNKKFLKRKLYALRMTESTSVTEHPPILREEKIGATIGEGKSSRQVDAWWTKRGVQWNLAIVGSLLIMGHVLALQDVNALCCEAERLQNKECEEIRRCYSCNDHELKIIGIGSIMVKMHDGTVRTIRMCDTLEGLRKNLLFLDNWDDLGCKINEGFFAERSWLTKVSLPFCEYCVISKQHRLKFKTSNSRSVYVLELVHSDVWQAPIQSLGGEKCFVSFIDDYSRRCWVYPIKKKSDVFKVFKVYKARVELDSGKKIKCLRTNNGGEYTSDEFDTFCRQEGIKRQFTTAYTPQHNEVAERMNITMLERARAMLATASLGKSFWAEAVNTACYVINRSPSTAVELKTPIEM